MYIRASDTLVEVWAPAKINLFLEVLGKRDDGFHEIETLMTPVGLFDTLYFQAETKRRGAATSIGLTCQWSSGCWGDRRGEKLPEGADNTVVRAVRLLQERTGTSAGATLRLVKRIPQAAGLAGGSSDAAAALAAANRGWRLGLSQAELAELAAQIGSDAPFFLAGGPAVCRGRGERVEPISRLGALRFVVVKPPDGLKTREVYARCQRAEAPRSSAALVEALRRGDIHGAGRLLHNQLQPAAEELSPWIARLKREFDKLDVAGHQMSGSGASYFGLCRGARHARRLARRLRARGVGDVFAVRSCC